MKKHGTVLIIVVVLALFNNSLFAIAASENPNAPTHLTLNEIYESNVYTNHPQDYYAFDVSKTSKIYIELDHVAMSHE